MAALALLNLSSKEYPLCLGLVQVKGAEPVLTEDETEAVVAAVAPFQQAYLGTCLTRMSDAATAAFPGGNRSLPTSAELQKFIGCAGKILNLLRQKRLQDACI